MTRHLSAHGITLQVPTGWDAAIKLTGGDGKSIHLPEAGTRNPVAHLANFPLPARRGDFGSGVVEIMDRRDIMVMLLEYDQEASSTALFKAHRPKRLDVSDFDTQQLQVQIPGKAGCQRFFSESNRAFCLYVVIGSWLLRHALIPIASQAVADITIENR